MKNGLMLAALVLGLAGSSAHAGTAAAKAKVRAETSFIEACGADGDKFCAGMTAGDGKLGPCLKEHEADLSRSCKMAMRRVAGKERRRTAAKACMADTAKFCPGMEPGDGKWGPCLRSHEAELTDGCKAARAAKRSARKAAHPPKGAPPR